MSVVFHAANAGDHSIRIIINDRNAVFAYHHDRDSARDDDNDNDGGDRICNAMCVISHVRIITIPILSISIVV